MSSDDPRWQEKYTEAAAERDTANARARARENEKLALLQVIEENQDDIRSFQERIQELERTVSDLRRHGAPPESVQAPSAEAVSGNGHGTEIVPTKMTKVSATGPDAMEEQADRIPNDGIRYIEEAPNVHLHYLIGDDDADEAGAEVEMVCHHCNVGVIFKFDLPERREDIPEGGHPTALEERGKFVKAHTHPLGGLENQWKLLCPMGYRIEAEIQI